ncbi:hypothetical protein Nmel_001404 [Mimus melanotis]
MGCVAVPILSLRTQRRSISAASTAVLPAESPSSSRKLPTITVPSPHKHCLNQRTL